MSIGSISPDPELSQWLQSLSTQSGAANSTAPALATLAPPDTSDVNTTTGASGHHHHHHGGISSKLESAISTALQSSDDTSDPNEVVQNTIKNFLESNANGTDANTTTTDTAAATATDPGDAAAQQTAFGDLLKSYGIDPQQFHQDLQSALQQSQGNGGRIDFSQVFQNFPAGSSIDTTA